MLLVRPNLVPPRDQYFAIIRDFLEKAASATRDARDFSAARALAQMRSVVRRQAVSALVALTALRPPVPSAWAAQGAFEMDMEFYARSLIGQPPPPPPPPTSHILNLLIYSPVARPGIRVAITKNIKSVLPPAL